MAGVADRATRLTRQTGLTGLTRLRRLTGLTINCLNMANMMLYAVLKGEGAQKNLFLSMVINYINSQISLGPAPESVLIRTKSKIISCIFS